MIPDRRPDLNDRPANDNRTLDLPDLFDRNYRRAPRKPLDPGVRRSLWIAVVALMGLLFLIGFILYLMRH